MIDDIPVARRQSSVYLTAPPSSRIKGWRWLIVGLCLVLGLGISLLVAWRPTDPSDALTQVTPVETPTSVPATAPGPEASDPAPAPSTPNARPSILGHFSYTEAPEEELQSVGTYHGRPTLLRQSAAQAYLEMAAAARSAGITLVPISGFRTHEVQEYLFFKRAQDRVQRPIERAEVSAPPGYSEHHTGYAVDIGDANAPGADVSVSFEQTQAFQWLQANAPRFSFELSFPPDNDQGVSYEPWHWRFVGDRHSLETFYADADVAP